MPYCTTLLVLFAMGCGASSSSMASAAGAVLGALGVPSHGSSNVMLSANFLFSFNSSVLPFIQWEEHSGAFPHPLPLPLL